MIKRINIILLMLGITMNLVAQQDAMYSQYVFNGLIINPAYAGTREMLSTTLLYRNQWVNVPGAPKTGLFSIDTPLKNRKVGLGLNMDFDKIGITSHSGVTGIYSYKIKFEKSLLSFGLQAGVGFSNSNFTAVDYSETGQSDEAFQSDFKYVLPNFGFGMYYYSDRFYAGFSVPQIAGRSIQKAISGNSEAAHLDLANHYLITSGYLFNLSPDIKFKPSVLLKYVNGAPVEIDINGIAWFYDIIALGASYRSLASVNLVAQVRVTNQLYLGYVYEYATTKLRTFSIGSHEFML
ncbi:MAG TPA: type IX secretion system membrane protein PorP/SprF, partial [Bacteroidales bacterium]|nr:type IX secretion system membrane protein PorP/SprF [Bacteroidales bacterium]